MSENIELELVKQFKASQEKYIYFLLAAAASAIGFAMAQLKVEPLSYIHIPLGASIIFWAASFISGLQFLEYAAGVTFQGQNYLALKRELHSYRRADAGELLVLFKSRLNETMEKQQSKMKLYSGLQSWCFLFGALAYIVWHGTRMWAINVLRVPLSCRLAGLVLPGNTGKDKAMSFWNLL